MYNISDKKNTGKSDDDDDDDEDDDNDNEKSSDTSDSDDVSKRITNLEKKDFNIYVFCNLSFLLGFRFIIQ